MINRILNYKLFIMYLFFGVLTTLINVLSYSYLTKLLGLSWEYSNIVSWICSVLFAYITNRCFVFKSENINILKEIISFFGFRFLSLVIDMIMMYIFVDLFFINDIYAKLITQVFVIIANYIFSKLYIFKK